MRKKSPRRVRLADYIAEILKDVGAAERRRSAGGQRPPPRHHRRTEGATGMPGLNPISRRELVRKRRNIMPLTTEVEQGEDGRWLAEVPELPGVLAHGQTRQEAIGRTQALCLRVLADRLDHGEPVPPVSNLFAVVP